jgi:hypothetical protein
VNRLATLGRIRSGVMAGFFAGLIAAAFGLVACASSWDGVRFTGRPCLAASGVTWLVTGLLVVRRRAGLIEWYRRSKAGVFLYSMAGYRFGVAAWGVAVALFGLALIVLSFIFPAPTQRG